MNARLAAAVLVAAAAPAAAFSDLPSVSAIRVAAAESAAETPTPAAAPAHDEALVEALVALLMNKDVLVLSAAAGAKDKDLFWGAAGVSYRYFVNGRWTTDLVAKDRHTGRETWSNEYWTADERTGLLIAEADMTSPPFAVVTLSTGKHWVFVPRLSETPTVDSVSAAVVPVTELREALRRAVERKNAEAIRAIKR